MLNCAEWTQNTWAIQAHKKKTKNWNELMKTTKMNKRIFQTTIHNNFHMQFSGAE